MAMRMFLGQRRREAEWLDDPSTDPAELRHSLAFIRKVNRFLGYTRIVLWHLSRFSVNWKQGRKIRILDVGTGSADIPCAILKWADQRGWDIEIVGVDINPQVANIAAEFAADPRLTIVRSDALNLPFVNAGFDYAITSMFLHHLSDEEAEQALAEMSRVSRRGIIASDLLRMHSAYAFIWLATMLASPMVKHDARVSVAQAFNKREIKAMRDRAGIGYAGYFGHLGHRFVLAGEKEEFRQMASAEVTVPT